ncbi:MAG: Glycogen synthase [Bacteroidia bacterium]|nr:Glycogen synthase [Bacteroidia bacterium]
MKKAKVLFVSSEITPYLEESHIGTIGRKLPQGIQERGKEIRTFMPRFGCINERRNQLHEVIRLSGMNLIINDNDHPLIIKVASIQSARMQVYFIDNEEYFQRKLTYVNQEGNLFEDSDERTIFFCRGVIETVKKLGWAPDVIHCHGWMTSMLPIMIKKAYSEDPIFADSKVVYSIYDDAFTGQMNAKTAQKLKMEGMNDKDLKHYKTPNYINLTKSAIDYSDAIIRGSEATEKEINTYLRSSGKPVLEYQSPEDYMDAYSEFYDAVLEEEGVFAD